MELCINLIEIAVDFGVLNLGFYYLKEYNQIFSPLSVGVCWCRLWSYLPNALKRNAIASFCSNSLGRLSTIPSTQLELNAICVAVIVLDKIDVSLVKRLPYLERVFQYSGLTPMKMVIPLSMALIDEEKMLENLMKLGGPAVYIGCAMAVGICCRTILFAPIDPEEQFP